MSEKMAEGNLLVNEAENLLFFKVCKCCDWSLLVKNFENEVKMLIEESKEVDKLTDMLKAVY